MKKLLPLVFVLCLLLGFKPDVPSSAFKSGKFKLPKGVTEKDYLPNTLIIKFKLGGAKDGNTVLNANVKKQLSIKGIELVALQQLFSPSKLAKQIESIEKTQNIPNLSSIYEAKYTGSKSITEVINLVLQDDDVLYAEPSYIYRTSYVTNDIAFSNQYSLPQVKAPQAWDVIKNASNIIIGIVDSGSDLKHEDLAGNIFINQADPVNGIDDDGDGFIDNYYGWDFVGKSATTLLQDNDPNVTSDTTDHGVHVSGIAAAVTDNGAGVSSVAFNAKLLIVKTGADDKMGTIYKGYEGIKYAADHGAQIINCSWGGEGGGRFGQDIIDYVVAKGCLVIAAAGNDNQDEEIFPASYKGVLSVASVIGTDVKSSFSSYGYAVDIAAPGSSIYNAINGNRYAVRSGTSMASPLVASAAALVKAKFTNYSGIQIGEQLRATADNIDAVNANYIGKLGKGRLNVLRALTESASSVRYQNLLIQDNSNGSRAPGDIIAVAFDLKSFLSPITGLNVNISSNSPYVQILDPNISVGNIGTLESKTNVGPVRVKILPNAPQNQDVSIKLSYTGNSGAFSDAEQFNITVALDYLNVEVNRVTSTFTSNGRVGFSKSNATAGKGFVYKDENMLFEAALMIGRSATQVSNNARNQTGSDENFVKEVGAALVRNNNIAFEANSVCNDSGSPNPLKIQVKSKMLAYSAQPDDKYVLIEYELVNQSGADLSGIYAGLFTDWDLDDASTNATQYNTANKTGYVYAKKNVAYPYAGVRLLSKDAVPAYYPMSYQLPSDPLADNNFTVAEKYEALSSGIKADGLGENTVNGYDVMFAIGAGPYNIPNGKSIKIAFAFVGGDDLTDLLNGSIHAQTKYDDYLVSLPQRGNTTEFKLLQNYPNPASTTTTVKFDLAEDSQVLLTLTDVNGKLLKTITNEKLSNGSYEKVIDVSHLATGTYLLKLSTGRFKKTLKVVVLR